MTETTFALLFFLFPLAYSPGPGNMFFAANGARFGLRATLRASLGYHAATMVVTLAIGCGLAATHGQSQAVFAAIRNAGSAYVLWIAWTFLRAGADTAATCARPAGVWAGILLLLLNPKAFIVVVLMFSQFLDPATHKPGHAVFWIASVFTLNNLVAFTAWTLAGDRLAALFRERASQRWLNRGFGVMLALVAVWMLTG